MSNTSQVGCPARPEIEKFADNAFSVARDRVLAKYADERNQVLAQVRLRGNKGGYLPALIKWGGQRVREMILAQADAYAEALTLHGVPSGNREETGLQTAAQQIAGGTVSAIRGELELLATRTRKDGNSSGGHVNREIEMAMDSALREGMLRLRRQRIKAKNSAEFAAGPTGLELAPRQPATGASDGKNSNPVDGGKKAQIIETMRLIEEWRTTAGEAGGKLTQEQVANMMNLDLRAYSAAKQGEPRGRDHIGRIQTFARTKGLI